MDAQYNLPAEVQKTQTNMQSDKDLVVYNMGKSKSNLNQNGPNKDSKDIQEDVTLQTKSILEIVNNECEAQEQPEEEQIPTFSGDQKIQNFKNIEEAANIDN